MADWTYATNNVGTWRIYSNDLQPVFEQDNVGTLRLIPSLANLVSGYPWAFQGYMWDLWFSENGMPHLPGYFETFPVTREKQIYDIRTLERHPSVLSMQLVVLPDLDCWPEGGPPEKQLRAKIAFAYSDADPNDDPNLYYLGPIHYLNTSAGAWFSEDPATAVGAMIWLAKGFDFGQCRMGANRNAAGPVDRNGNVWAMSDFGRTV